MKSKIIRSLWALVLCTGLISCSTLHSPYYVGEISDISEEDLAEESIWVMDEDTYTIRRTGSNSFVAATMEWNSNTKEYNAHTSPILLTELDDHLFLNIQDDDGYLIIRAVCSLDESLVLFTIDKDKIEQDIKSKKLKAREDGDHIFMECSKEEQDEYIRNNIETMFSYECARVARMVYEKEKKRTKNSR